jgi:hypothetical protein
MAGLSAGCAGLLAPAHVAPGEGYEVEFSTAEPKLRIQAIAIDGAVACEPAAEGEGRPECEVPFVTRVTPGRHYLQIQVTKRSEGGHKDAEERIGFDADGRYACVVSEHFVTTGKTAIEEFGFPEPIVECRVLDAKPKPMPEAEPEADEPATPEAEDATEPEADDVAASEAADVAEPEAEADDVATPEADDVATPEAAAPG